LVGFYGEEQDVGVFGNGDVAGAGVDAELLGNGGGMLGRGVGAVDFGGRDGAACDDALDHGLCHVSASDESKLHNSLLKWRVLKRDSPFWTLFGGLPGLFCVAWALVAVARIRLGDRCWPTNSFPPILCHCEWRLGYGLHFLQGE